MCAAFLASVASAPPMMIILEMAALTFSSSTGETPLCRSGETGGSAGGPSRSTPAGCASTPKVTSRRRGEARRPRLLRASDGVHAVDCHARRRIPAATAAVPAAAAAATLPRRQKRAMSTRDADLRGTVTQPCLRRIGVAPPTEKWAWSCHAAVTAIRCTGGSTRLSRLAAALCWYIQGIKHTMGQLVGRQELVHQDLMLTNVLRWLICVLVSGFPVITGANNGRTFSQRLCVSKHGPSPDY